MDNFRVLVVRYERKAAYHFAYCTLAVLLIPWYSYAFLDWLRVDVEVPFMTFQP